VKSLTATQIAYLAGLIDGEGSIFVQRVKTSNKKASKSGYHYRAGFAISMTNRPIVDWCAKVTGCGKISSPKKCKPNHRPGHRWSVWSREASTLLLLLVPYLRLKKGHAHNLIKFQSRMGWFGVTGNSKSEIKRREKHRLLSLSLNKRGR
jgi:LAGLIDADG endonuclease